MEAGTEDPGLTRRPTLASSWDAPCGALTQSLFLSRGGLGAGEFDWEELLAPPAPGQDLMILKRSLSSQEESPCFLYLTCDPNGGEEIVSLGILSSARNMEVYLGEEYLGTSRGRNVCTVLDNSEPEKIILYKKYLKLESPTHACKVKDKHWTVVRAHQPFYNRKMKLPTPTKLLSFGEKHYVFISKIVVHMRPASASSSASCRALGSRIDLGRVQTIVESIGSKLSPGAQQLMNMVRVQQQNYMPLGEQLQSVLGNTGDKLMIGRQSAPILAALNKSPFTPFPFRTGLTPGKMPDNVRADPDKNVRPPGGGDPSDPRECGSVLQSQALLDSRLQDAISSFLPKKASGNSDIPSSDLLPFLQNLCSQVNHLRVGSKTEWREKITKPGDGGGGGVGVEEQPVCSYLEKILSKNMELMEKNLTDYIDQRLCKLQEHFDNKIALLMDLLQSSNSLAPGMPLRQCDSGERLSNGER